MGAKTIMNEIGYVKGLENEAKKESYLHLLDGRVKLLILLIIIIYAVFTTQITVLILLEFYLLLLIYISKISFKTALIRVLLLLPFGGFIIAFQPFIHPGNVIWTLPFSINVTDAGLIWAALLFSRLIVSLTATVLLSSISPMQEVVQSFRKLSMPKEFAMIFSLMIRFLFMFLDELNRIRNAQKTRNFDIFNKKTTYMWRMKQLGYTIAMMFLRAYEQGEKIYLSMVSRGYSDNSNLFTEDKNKIGSKEYLFIVVTISLILGIEIIRYFIIF